MRTSLRIVSCLAVALALALGSQARHSGVHEVEALVSLPKDALSLPAPNGRVEVIAMGDQGLVAVRVSADVPGDAVAEANRLAEELAATSNAADQRQRAAALQAAIVRRVAAESRLRVLESHLSAPVTETTSHQIRPAASAWSARAETARASLEGSYRRLVAGESPDRIPGIAADPFVVALKRQLGGIEDALSTLRGEGDASQQQLNGTVQLRDRVRAELDQTLQRMAAELRRDYEGAVARERASRQLNPVGTTGVGAARPSRAARAIDVAAARDERDEAVRLEQTLRRELERADAAARVVRTAEAPLAPAVWWLLTAATLALGALCAVLSLEPAVRRRHFRMPSRYAFARAGMHPPRRVSTSSRRHAA